MSQEVKYYDVYPAVDFGYYEVKGTYDAAFKFGVATLKKEYGITEEVLPKIININTGVRAKSYGDLLTIEETDIEDFLDTVQAGAYADDFSGPTGRQWVLDHMDDFFDILNDDGTIATERGY